MSSSSSSGGVGFLGLLAILFIGLKLGGVIDWSWWWVVSPLWIPIALFLAVIILIAEMQKQLLTKLPRSRKGQTYGYWWSTRTERGRARREQVCRQLAELASRQSKRN